METYDPNEPQIAREIKQHLANDTPRPSAVRLSGPDFVIAYVYLWDTIRTERDTSMPVGQYSLVYR